MLLAALGPCLSMATVEAGYIVVESPGNTYVLNPGTVSIFGGDSGQISDLDLSTLYAELNGDGIVTANRITFLLASTDSGMAFVSLFDGAEKNEPISGDFDAFLGLSTTASIDAGWLINNDNSDQTDWYDLGNGFQMVNSFYQWSSGQEGEAFAWVDFDPGFVGTMNFYDLGLDQLAQPTPFQFVSRGVTQWEIAGLAGFTSAGQYAMGFQYVPAPGALGLLAAAGLLGPRRRRGG